MQVFVTFITLQQYCQPFFLLILTTNSRFTRILVSPFKSGDIFMNSLPARNRLFPFPAIVFVFILLCLPSLVVAQFDALRFDHLSIEEGLSQSNVQWILQDHLGFIWFSTQDGLNKYDGYSFTVYSHDPQSASSIAGNALHQMYEDHNGNIWIFLGIGGINKFDRATEQFTYYNYKKDSPNSLSSDVVTSFLEDKRGKLWIGTSGGLDQLDPRTGIITHYKHVGKDSGETGSNAITVIFEDKSGLLWFGTQNGLRRYDAENDHLSRYALGLSNPYVTVIHESHDGNLWIGTMDGLNKLEKREGKFTQFRRYENETNSLSGNIITSIIQEREGALWVGTTQGLTRFDERRTTFTRYAHSPSNSYSLSENSISTLKEDSHGMIWITTASGHLNLFDKKSRKALRLEHNPSDPKSLSHNNVSVVFEDRSGTIWIGTQGGGVNKYNRAKQKFRYYHYNPASPRGLSGNSVTSILEDGEGILWIGTQESGLNRYDRNNDRTTYFKHQPENPRSLSHNSITSIYEDKSGTLWIGAQNGLNSFDKRTNTFTRFLHSNGNTKSLSYGLVNCMVEDRFGTLWIGTDSGLNSYNRARKEFRRYLPDPANPRSLSSRLVWSLYEDREGTLWVGTAIGALNAFNRATGDFDRYAYNPQDSGSINNRTITVVYETEPQQGERRGTLWFGTYSGGLNKFDRVKRTFTHFTEKEGLPNNRINGILEDGNRNLWISTNKGLAKLDPATLQIRTYDFTDGLQSSEFIRGAFCKTKDGEMFFGGINGMNSFYPDNIQDNPYVPAIVLTQFKKFDKPMKFERDISSIEEIALTYEDNFFSIEFAALDYAASQKNQYAYKMEGFDFDWIYSGGRRYTSYTNLDPGEYVFRFKGSNNDGKWNETGKSIVIHITPPFYKTLWFRISAVLSILAITYVTYRIRIRSISAQKKKLESLVTERTHELNRKTVELQAARDELEHRVLERTAELRSSNESLRKLKDFNENLIQTMVEGITVFDERGNITYVNPAITSQLNYTAEELIGKHWSFLVPSNLHQLVHAADERRMRGIADRYELQLIRKDGTRNFFLVSGSPIFENGKFSGTFTVFTNITERKHAEERIQDQAALIETARDAIVVCDIEGKITYSNKSSEIVYGWRKEEILGKNVADVFYREHSPEHIEAQRSVLEKGEWLGELHQSRKDTKTVIVDSRWTLLRDHEGFPKSILLINTDITERVKLQMQFLRTQRLESLGTLASGIAHDLNNVLSPILLAVQILKNKMIDEGGQKLLDTLEGAAKRASGIVRQVLTFARGAEGKKEPLQPKHFIRELESIIRETFPKDIALKTTIQKDSWMVPADPTQLHQVLLNLCVNARDAMPEGGTLTLAVENTRFNEEYARLHPQAKAGAYVAFMVADTGIGMTRDVMEKIFEPFFTTKGIGKGTGLGLSTVMGIVKSHGGFINVYSEPGKGTAFKIYLPAGITPDEQKKESFIANLPSGNGETILVVDDEIAIRQITKGTLETYGYKVLTATNGIEAEEIFRERQNTIELLLTDMMMPSRGGEETIKILRALKPDLRIVIASGLVSYQNASGELGNIANAFLPKPYTAETLLKTIAEALAKKG
ncbi:MAG: PAS domain S-box protein [Bacteroidetes bacterium]|nr:MAG: PAS domain S-box protein [Bacteroidota bacterium]